MTKWILRKCTNCLRYSMHIELCPYCGGRLKIPHPAKFSPDDKYIKYRIRNVKTSEKKTE